MARPYWSGQITISLVSFGVKLFVATETKSQISFHQISRRTGERVRHQKVLASAQPMVPAAPAFAPEDEGDAEEPVTVTHRSSNNRAAYTASTPAAPKPLPSAFAQAAAGNTAAQATAIPASAIVENDEIVKGYEYRKGEYVTIEPEELAHLRVPSKHAMEVLQFVDRKEIDPEYFEKPYFVVPENDTQAPAFAVIRAALKETGKVALSKIAFNGREHVVAITPTEDDALGGMMAYTMRYAEELRDPAEYFRDIKETAIDEDSLDLAKQLIKRKSSAFDPKQFQDGYEVALKELVQAKIDHAPVPRDEEPTPKRSNVVSLMDALRKSISPEPTDEQHEENEEEAKPAATTRKKPAASEKGKGISLVKPEKADKAATPKAAAKSSAKSTAKPAKATRRKSA